MRVLMGAGLDLVARVDRRSCIADLLAIADDWLALADICQRGLVALRHEGGERSGRKQISSSPQYLPVVL